MTDIFLLITGFIVGGMNAIAGGGMLIGFPALLAIGVPAIVANGHSQSDRTARSNKRRLRLSGSIWLVFPGATYCSISLW